MCGGWCDIGYNAIVDKWGILYEGAPGSLERTTIGTHAAGFNTLTFGVSILGDYASLHLSEVTLRTAGALLGVKLAAHGVHSEGTVDIYTSEGENSRYKHREVTLP